jgi:two-component system LytT family response regulator
MSSQTNSPVIQAIIIDDEPLARLIVKEYLQDYPQISVAQECGDGFEGLKAIQQHKPDLIFLDIQMPKINGFEMLELIEEPPGVIFTTAYDEYAIRAFESHAVDYLLKPFSKQRFAKAIQKWLDARAAAGQPAADPGGSAPAPAGPPAGPQAATRALLETAAASPSQQQRIVVKTGGKIKIIPVEDVQYLEASDDYVKIHTKSGVFLKNKTMNFFEQALDPVQFVRTHRSYILNIQQVTRIEPYEKDGHLCILQTGAQIPVSKTGYTRLKEVLGL